MLARFRVVGSGLMRFHLLVYDIKAAGSMDFSYKAHRLRHVEQEISGRFPSGVPSEGHSAGIPHDVRVPIQWTVSQKKVRGMLALWRGVFRLG